jgi:hypothetical protein
MVANATLSITHSFCDMIDPIPIHRTAARE